MPLPSSRSNGSASSPSARSTGRSRPGHETTLQVIELGERLGYDSAWVRHRHLQYGISSPVAVLAAASQRTRRIALGTAVIPLGWENPLRLAEDLATVDILTGGRLNPGVSVGPPMRYAEVRDSLYPDTGDIEDFSYERVERLLRLLDGGQASPFRGVEGIEEFSDKVQPQSPGCAPDVVRRGQRAVGGVGGRAQDEPAVQQRGPRGRR
jgi:alkanesulfonate monooxygenase SsuD/methylene tetrahydromethanopterin reductase-like flavin-dependent oxidoreductase (luciferase family)